MYTRVLLKVMYSLLLDSCPFPGTHCTVRLCTHGRLRVRYVAWNVRLREREWGGGDWGGGGERERERGREGGRAGGEKDGV